MAGSLDETIGARLLVLGRAQFVTEIQAAIGVINDYADASERAAAASAKMSDGMKASADASTEAAASQKVAAGASADAAAEQADSADLIAGSAVVASSKVKTAADDTVNHVSRISGAAASVLKWGSVALAGVGYESVKTYLKLQQQMEQVSTQAGINQKRIPFLTSGVMQIAQKTGEAFSDVADQLYRIASAKGGLHETNKELLKLTQAAADLSVLGGPTTNPEQTARIFGALATSGDILTTGGKPPSPQQAAAWANAVVGKGDMRMSDLVAALGTGMLSTGRLYGVSLQDMGAWLDVMTSQAMSGSKSGTLITHAMSLLATPSQTAAEAESLFGMHPGELESLMKTKGLGAAVLKLNEAFHKGIVDNPNFFTKFYGSGVSGEETLLRAWQFTPAQIKQMMTGHFSKIMETQFLTHMFGGAKQEVPILTLLNESGLYKSKLAGIQAMSNMPTWQKDLAHTLGEPANQIQILFRNLQSVGVEIGKEVTPALIDLLHVLESVGKWFGHNKWALDAVLGTGGALFGAAAVYKTTQEVVKIAKGATSVVKVVGKALGLGSSASTAGASAGLDGSATALNEAAAALSDAALKLGASGIRPGTSVIPGGVNPDNPNPEGDVAVAGGGLLAFATGGAEVGAVLAAESRLGGGALDLVSKVDPRLAKFLKTAKYSNHYLSDVTGPTFARGSTKAFDSIRHEGASIFDAILGRHPDLHLSPLFHGFPSSSSSSSLSRQVNSLLSKTGSSLERDASETHKAADKMDHSSSLMDQSGNRHLDAAQKAENAAEMQRSAAATFAAAVQAFGGAEGALLGKVEAATRARDARA